MIRPADIVLVRGSGFVADVIERITHSPYSHTAGIVKPNELIETQAFRRTGYQALDAYAGCSDIFTCDTLSDDQRKRIVAFVMSRVGRKYDYALIAWEVEHYILHVNFPYSEGDRNDCSTLWSDAYRSEGVDPYPGVEFLTPAHWGESKIMRKVASL